jgi:hypothetical protein
LIDLDNLSPKNTERFNEIIPLVSLKYNKIISDISDYYPHDLSWQLSSIISRHPSLTKIHRRCCQLFFLKIFILKKNNPVFIKSNDKILSRIINNYFKGNKYNSKSIFEQNFFDRLIAKLRPIKSTVLILSKVFLEYLFSRFTRLFFLKIKIYPKSISLIDTFVIPSSFNSNNSTYSDRYYTGALSSLNSDDRANFFYLPTFVGLNMLQYLKYFLKIRHQSDHFILKEDYLQLGDYISAFIDMVKLRGKSKTIFSTPVFFEGFEISKYLLYDIKNSFINEQTYRGLLNYKFVSRLKDSNLDIFSLIDWNENQVGDRGLVKGFHDHLPQVKTMGYQGFIVDYDYHVYLKPTENEFDKGFIPHVYHVIGNGLIHTINEYCQKLTINVAPAFRYRHVWNYENQKKVSRNVVISLPIENKIAFKMMKFVNEGIQGNNINFHLFIKPHPLHNSSKIKKYWDKYENQDDLKIEILNQSFEQTLKSADVLISSYSSSAIESLICGIPTIILKGFDIFDHNPIPSDIDEEFLFYSNEPSSLYKAIQTCLDYDHNKKTKFQKSGKKIRLKYFHDCDLSSTSHFFGLS